MNIIETTTSRQHEVTLQERTVLPRKTSFRPEANELAGVCYEIAKKALTENMGWSVSYTERPIPYVKPYSEEPCLKNLMNSHITEITDPDSFKICFALNPLLSSPGMAEQSPNFVDYVYIKALNSALSINRMNCTVIEGSSLISSSQKVATQETIKNFTDWLKTNVLQESYKLTDQ